MKKLKHILILLLPLLSIDVAMSQVESGALFISREYNPTSWGDNFLPKDSGLKLSKEFGGISFTGRYASYTKADTWYLTYGSDGAMYSSYTDGTVNGQLGWTPNPRCAKVVGYDPLDLRVSVVGKKLVHSGKNGPGGKFVFGRYPAAQLIYNDVWYYGTYLLEWDDYSLKIANHDWQVLQPFIGFRVSDDFGKNWYDKTEPNRPLLENAHDKWVNDFNVEFNPYEIMIGAPHFVDFGENLEYAPTDNATNRKWAYMVAHGADAGSTLAHNTWVSGDNIYLLRILMPEGVDVEENFNYINNPANWQYLAKDGSYKNWNRNNLQEVYSNIKPLVDATGYMGNVMITYNAPLNKYIMTLSRMGGLRDYFDTLILEADAIDGDYRVIQYMKGFATASYFMNIPSRFISDDGKTMWLCYSSNYDCNNAPVPNIGGSSYALCLTEFTLDNTKKAAASKYEAEGMRRLGGAAIKVEKGNSNDASMGGIIRIGDGVEFHSKSEGNALAVVASMKCASKQISVYVNDKYKGSVVLSAPRNMADVSLNYLPVKVSYGDKVRLSLEVSDMESNRYYVEQRSRAINIDYVVVDNITSCQAQSAVGNHYAVAADKAGEHTLLLRYKLLGEAETMMSVKVNDKDYDLYLPAIKRAGIVQTKALRVDLHSGENSVKIDHNDGVEVLGVMCSDYHFDLAASVKIQPQADGSIDACDMLRNGLTTMTVHPGYTGKGFVAGLVALNKEAWLGCVPEVESGDYTLSIRYSAGELSNTTLSDKRLLQLIVGEKVTIVEFPLTDGWKQWREVSLPIRINKGEMIALKAHRRKDTDDCINIDRFVLK